VTEQTPEPAAQTPTQTATETADPTTVPVDQPGTTAPADPTTAVASTALAPAVGDLCTFTTEDEAGFATLHTCVVFEVFTEPDEDGNEVPLARVGVLPDERIVRAAHLAHRS